MLKEHSKTTLSPVQIAVLAALYPAYQAVAQDDFTLEEIVVTATKRSLSIQDIASTVQAIPEATLKQMGAKSMEDFARCEVESRHACGKLLLLPMRDTLLENESL